MKHTGWCICIAAVLCLICTFSSADGLEAAAQGVPAQCFLDENGVDTVLRMDTQPVIGMSEDIQGDVILFLDLVEQPDADDWIVIRVTVASESWEALNNQRMQLRAGKKTYTIPCDRTISEYDMTFYEDDILFLTGKSLPVLEELAKSRDGRLTITLIGTETTQAQFVVDTEMVQQILKLYRKLGGTKQDLSALEECYPVEVE
ncbi:MAG: hypothetical protein IJ246_02610 [Clostridia bacterium]|nr:hypothetical protein [Clostridia bacterium]